MEEHMVSRRGTLKYFGLLISTETGRAFASQWLSGNTKLLAASCAGEMGQSMESALPDSSRADYQPRFFKPDEFETVEILTEMIIPTDDKPGAREARVANYIDFITFSAAEFKPELQRQWSDGLRALDGLSRQKYTQPFREISPAQREELLTEMSLPEREPNTEHAGYSFYRLVKEMTVEGFYSSRVGLMDVLEYKGLAFLSSFPGCTHPEHH